MEAVKVEMVGGGVYSSRMSVHILVLDGVADFTVKVHNLENLGL